MKKVFIIDDEEMIVNMVKYYLDKNGFICETSTTGVEVLPKIRAFDPDIILCDILMEPVSGLDVYYLIKRNLDTSSIPFVFISGKHLKEDIIKGLEIGADDYLPKPLEMEDLKNRLLHIISKRRISRLQELCVLLVDKSKVILKKTECELAEDDFCITTASSIQEAVEFITKNEIDVIICGAKLIDGSGYGLCKTVKELNNNIKFLLMISEGNTEALVLGNEAGVDDFIMKNLGVDGIRIKLARISQQTPSSSLIKKYAIEKENIFPILQNCEIKGFTGSIIITSPEGKGKVQMQKGEYIDIAFNELTGADALETLTALTKGEIVIKQENIIV